MPTPIPELLDLNLAWKRLQLDFSENRLFMEFPNELRLFEAYPNELVGSIEAEIANGTFSPKQAIVVEIPKPGGSTRPAAYLEFPDRLVYSALVGACYKPIYDFIEKNIGEIDIAYPMFADSTTVRWISPGFRAWTEFREKSLKQIEDFASFVVLTDVSACFENIDIKSLIHDLRQVGCDSGVLDLLSKCLNTWAKLDGRGIPQGYGASDILGKFYLSQIDRSLKEHFQHLRYVDDIRIFCSSKIEGKKSLMELVKALRARGLNIQTSKTGIYTGAQAKKIIEGVQPIIREIRQQYNAEIADIFEASYPGSPSPGFTAHSLQEEIPLTVTIRAFEKYFVNGNDEEFDKTLFHFLLNKLGAAKSNHGIKYALHTLESHPEETSSILKYFRQIQLENLDDLFGTVLNFLTSYLGSDRSIYQYQNYLIIRYLSEIEFEPPLLLLTEIRRIVFEKKSELYLSCGALDFLTRHGGQNDFERIAYEFSTYHPKIQVQAVFTLGSMERIKRNGFYARISQNDPWVERAIKCVKISE